MLGPTIITTLQCNDFSSSNNNIINNNSNCNNNSKVYIRCLATQTMLDLIRFQRILNRHHIQLFLLLHHRLLLLHPPLRITHTHSMLRQHTLRIATICPIKMRCTLQIKCNRWSLITRVLIRSVRLLRIHSQPTRSAVLRSTDNMAPLPIIRRILITITIRTITQRIMRRRMHVNFLLRNI